MVLLVVKKTFDSKDDSFSVSESTLKGRNKSTKIKFNVVKRWGMWDV